MPAVSQQSSDVKKQDTEKQPVSDHRTLDDKAKVTDENKPLDSSTIILKTYRYSLPDVTLKKKSLWKRFKSLFRKKKSREQYFERKKPQHKSTSRALPSLKDSRILSVRTNLCCKSHHIEE